MKVVPFTINFLGLKMGKFLERVKNYLSFVRFGHTVFAMPFALIGFFMGVADSTFSFRLLILVVLYGIRQKCGDGLQQDSRLEI